MQILDKIDDAIESTNKRCEELTNAADGLMAAIDEALNQLKKVSDASNV